MKKVSKDRVINELRVYVQRNFTTQQAAAKAWGISPAMVSSVLSNKKLPTKEMLKSIGVRAVEVVQQYERV